MGRDWRPGVILRAFGGGLGLALTVLLGTQDAVAGMVQCTDEFGNAFFTEKVGRCNDRNAAQPLSLQVSTGAPRREVVLNPECASEQEMHQIGSAPLRNLGGLAFDGEFLWALSYMTPNAYAVKLDPVRGGVEGPATPEFKADLIAALANPAGRDPDFVAIGGAAFGGARLWVSSAWGRAYAGIDPAGNGSPREFSHEYRKLDGSASYAAAAYDGENLWMIWQGQDYDRPNAEMQQLLRVNPNTGVVSAAYPADMGAARDAAHGLAWDGLQLWHGKGSKIRAVDPNSGRTIDEFTLKRFRRVSGMASDGCHLYFGAHDGSIWKVAIQTFVESSPSSGSVGAVSE